VKIPQELIEQWCNNYANMWLRGAEITQSREQYVADKAAAYATEATKERCALELERRAAAAHFGHTEITLTQAAKAIRALSED